MDFSSDGPCFVYRGILMLKQKKDKHKLLKKIYQRFRLIDSVMTKKRINYDVTDICKYFW